MSRKTKETDFTVAVNLDGAGEAEIATGLGFFDHMLAQIARHGLVDLTVRGKGDLDIDGHHTVEDIGIILGGALAKALGDRAGITRYADVRLPMMDALVHVAADFGGRGNLVFRAAFPEAHIGEFDTSLVREFLLVGGHPRGYRPPRRGLLRGQQPPHGGSRIQGLRAGVARGRRAGSERRERAQYQGCSIGRIFVVPSLWGC